MQKRNILQAEEALLETLSGAPVQDACRLRWMAKTRAWMKVQPSTVNGMKMGVQEWRDALFLK